MQEEFSGLIEDTPERRKELAATSIDFHSLVDGLYATPEEVDPREHMIVENQGSMGSCQGHDISTCLELCYFIGSGEYIELSRMFAYIGTQKIDGILGRDHGSTISGGVRLAKEFGICREEVMPYPNPVRYSTKFAQGCWEDAKNFKIRSHSVLRSYDDVFTYLASGIGAVSIGIRWSQACSFKDNILYKFQDRGRGGHAVCFCGYTKRKQEGRNYIILANSWGTQWQDSGYCEVAPSAIDAMFKSRFTNAIGVSDMTVPKPRPYNFLKEFLK